MDFTFTPTDASAGPVPLWSTLNGNDKQAKPAPAPIDKQAQQTITAQATLASTAAPSAAVASSLATSVQKNDPVQASADVLRLSSAALEKSNSAGAAKLGVGGNLLTSVNQAAQGDTYSAAVAAQTAVQKISPALSETPVGAVTNAVLLGTGNKKILTQVKDVAANAVKALDPRKPAVARAKAALDATCNLQTVALVGRAMGNALIGLGKFTVKRAERVSTLAPAAGKVEASAVKVAESPVGRMFGWMNKWIPLLNVAGVALSAKEAVDVFRDHKSSTTTKALSMGSIGMAIASLVAGLTLGGGPFLAVIAASIVAEIALDKARKRDHLTGDMDRQSSYWLNHPGAALRDLAGYLRQAVPHLGAMAIATLTRPFHKKPTQNPAQPAQS